MKKLRAVEVSAGQWMDTFRAGFTAVPWQKDRIITVGVWTVLFDVLTVNLPKHLAATILLLHKIREIGASYNKLKGGLSQSEPDIYIYICRGRD